MRLSWGSYSWDVNSLFISSSDEPRLTESGRPYSVIRTMNVKGSILGSGPDDLATKVTTMKTALKVPYQDLTFTTDTGGATPETLKNSTSITGVRVIHGPNFPDGKDAQYVNLRDFAFTAQAEYELSGTSQQLLAWRETLDFSGGGPIYVYKPALNGPPQKQRTWFAIPYQVIQHGEAVGYLQYPSAPAPLWPAFLMETPHIVQSSPDRRGPTRYQSYRTAWSYRFQSPTPLVGLPTLWPRGQ